MAKKRVKKAQKTNVRPYTFVLVGLLLAAVVTLQWVGKKHPNAVHRNQKHMSKGMKSLKSRLKEERDFKKHQKAMLKDMESIY